MTPYELAKLLEANKNPILELVRTSRPYKTPKGFIDWRAISAIVTLQCLLTLTYAPELLGIEPAQDHLSIARKYRMREHHEPTWRYPRWLGKEYHSPKSSHSGGTHASPRSHWRAGHWCRVVVGSRELQERRWVWIQPVYLKA